MKLSDSQSFLSLYYEPNVVETATGHSDPHDAANAWDRETKSLGQVPTPQPIAEMMARWVTSKRPLTILDPAVGMGGLLHECHKLCPFAKYVGVERDQETLLQAKFAAPNGTKLVLADYLLSESGQFDGIIANPPYVKAQRLAYHADTWRSFEERFGTTLDRLTNLYALFLLKIWQDLALHGRAAVIIPAEFLNANFGEEIKERLLKQMRPPGIIVFSPSLNLFKESLTTSTIIFLEKGRPKSAPCKLAKADSLAEAEVFLQTLINEDASALSTDYRDLDALKSGDKWLNSLLNGTSQAKAHQMPKVIGDYFDCRRGIATGANDFFCLSKSGLDQAGLELSHVDACIAKATDADGLVFTPEKLSALASADRRCYLLNPRHNGTALASYLQIGERSGIPQRHLPSHRPVWYLPENRAVADIWVAVFSRENIKFILNTSGAKNLTCFHGLYAKADNKNLAPLITLYLNSSWGHEAFAQVNRFYGDGLNKLEPKDVEALPCPEMPKQSIDLANNLHANLLMIEKFPANARQGEIDRFASKFLNLQVLEVL